VAAILANPRYTGRQVWNRQPAQAVLVDPADTGLGHKQVQRWNLPEGWVISKHPAHTSVRGCVSSDAERFLRCFFGRL
jgi:dihydroorotase-like cyclic amidohydrolase